jgi:hypothetical protein
MITNSMMSPSAHSLGSLPSVPSLLKMLLTLSLRHSTHHPVQLTLASPPPRTEQLDPGRQLGQDLTGFSLWLLVGVLPGSQTRPQESST